MKQFSSLFFIILILLTSTGCSGPAKTTVPTLPPNLIPNAATSPVLPTPVPGQGGPVEQSPTPAPPPGIWAANPADGVILRVDPASGAVAARIRVQGSPEIVAVGAGGVWALDRQHNLLFRINPFTNKVQATIKLPDGIATDLVAGDATVWVGMIGKVDLTRQTPGQVDDEIPGMVVTINADTNQPGSQYAIQPVSRLALGGSALWILSRTAIDTPVQVIDLTTHQGMAVPFHNAPEWLTAEAIAVDAGSLWLFSSAYARIFRAGLDGRINAAIPIQERQPNGYADLLLHAGSLWAATPWGTVLRIDPQTNRVLAAIELDTPLTRLIAGSAPDPAVWVLSQPSARLFRIDPATNQVTAQVNTGSPLQPTVVPSPTPRVVITRPCPDAAPSRLKIGDLAYVTKDPPLPNRVRQDPNTDADILGHINPGGSMEILEGPACANGWVWWRVKNADVEGWTPEGDKETYWLIPLFQ